MLALGKLLELTLAGREPAEKTQLTVEGVRMRWLSEGALEVRPPEARDNGLDLLLSAGIHGNETAPIELLDRLLHDIARGDLKPRARILFLFGNPEAIRKGERFVEQDVNRLFNGRHEQSSGSEALRACELERLAARAVEVAAIADNVTIIRDGSTVGVMYVTPETPLDQEELIRKMVGRPLHNLYPNHPSNTPGEEYLRVEDWTVHHPLDAERVIVDHANINVHAGEIVGLAGLMGAGRTEMAMSIFGHSYGSNISGKVFVKGKEVKMPNVQSAIDAGLAYATEDRKGNGLNLLQNIRENASLASLTKISKGGVVDDNLERKEVEQYRKQYAPTFGASLKAGNLAGPYQIHAQYRERLKQFLSGALK
mgnify:CR=1 FL=1